MEEQMETMEDYQKELDASLKQISEGDILTGTVIGVGDDEITLDLQSYTEGIITKEHFSNDPACILKEAVQPGDEITATVLKRTTARDMSFCPGKKRTIPWPGIKWCSAWKTSRCFM